MHSLLTPQIAAAFMDDAERAGRRLRHLSSPKVPQPSGTLRGRLRSRRALRSAHA